MNGERGNEALLLSMGKVADVVDIGARAGARSGRVRLIAERRGGSRSKCYRVTYLRWCARFHGLGAVRGPETGPRSTRAENTAGGDGGAIKTKQRGQEQRRHRAITISERWRKMSTRRGKRGREREARKHDAIRKRCESFASFPALSLSLSLCCHCCRHTTTRRRRRRRY
jgi:hypothetical protein